MAYCIKHMNRASKRGSLNSIPSDQNEVKPEVSGKSLSKKNTSDGRAPGVSGGNNNIGTARY